MYPTLLAFASLVAAIASVGSEETSSSGTRMDAWTTVSLQDKFYLIYRSYRNDEGLGGTGKCVSIQLSEKDETAKTTKSTMKYLDPKTNQMIEKNVRGKVAPSSGDTIQMSDTEGWTAEHKFAYSDYETCDVVVVLGTEEKKCELWVKQDYQQLPQAETDAVDSRAGTSVNQNIAKCEEEYNNQCPKEKKYRIYDTATCSSK
uniref:Lipocalin-like tick salivary secreted protein n=1 Tax=Ixodes scapularis TaxID=6945 RepID=Q4PN08_IXOSC|nr:lipocalin-like tick salivary secreted protein [Ixodes scapularis]